MSSSRYFVTVELKVKDGQSPSVVHEALQKLAAAAKQQPHCSLFMVHQDSVDPQRFVLWEGFQDEESFKQHGAAPHSQHFAALGLVEPVRVLKAITSQ